MYYTIATVVALSAAAIVLSSLYFRRFQLIRPPIGVFNLRDLIYMMVSIIIVPFLYLTLPIWFVAVLLIGSTASLLVFTWEPVLLVRWAIWLATIAVLGSDIWAALLYGSGSPVFSAVNDLAIVILVVGITNLWAQSGMKARYVTILSGALMVYDFTATTIFSLMGDMMHSLAGFPLSPQITWGTPNTELYASIGLGDLLLASVFPLTMRKAYGPQAGYIAIAISVAATLGMFLTPIGTIFPAMIVLGPLTIVQFVYWSRRLGSERTMREYLQMEPV